MNYNDPLHSSASSIGSQTVTDYFKKKALIEARKLQYFSQLADVTAMPKNMGKKITQFLYLPLLDDRNLNDQGIDAAGVTIDSGYHQIWFPATTLQASETGYGAAKTAIEASGLVVSAGGLNSGASGTNWRTLTITGLGTAATVAASKGASPAPSIAGDNAMQLYGVFSAVQKTALLAAGIKLNDVAGTAVNFLTKQLSGNLYGSSKDIGTISGKLPALSETGGRVNRVGFKRIQLEGTFEKFGFFDEYTQESLDFDSDAELQMHIHREMVDGATEMTEDALQVDLLTAAGVVRYAGDATSTASVGANDVVDYGDLLRLSIDLDNNRCPKQTTIITGTRLVDTQTINGNRVLYVGSELIPTLRAMVDLHSNPAFVSVEKYAAGSTVLNGEIGTIDQFRIVVVPEMMKWAGAGAAIGADATMYSTNGRFDVFPLLCVGEGSFTTIGFQTDGKGVKFAITHVPPGKDTADRTDPYGETGFMSIKWYYGFMVLRSERIGLIKSVALM
jgi:N4-gp56 family major capsid protein